MSWTGYIGVFISVLGFGSNFVPLKRVKIGDGVFFQFIMCNAIFITSIPVLAIQKFPKMHGLALLGGFLWCSGNMLCPLSIRYIGMGLGLLVWGGTSMLMGWASGRYGLFGLKKQEISDPDLNLAGMMIALVGLLIFLQVKSKDTSVDATQQAAVDAKSDSAMFSPLITSDDVEGNHDGSSSVDLKMKSDVAVVELSDQSKRIVGLTLAIAAGVFFGCNFDPSQYVIDNKYDGDDNTLNYVFAHFCGILITSWFYTILYCIYKVYYVKEQPYVSADCILPGTLSGLMWAVAQIAWFYANGQLGFAVTFPIVSCGPGFVGSLWGIFLFKEISGVRDIGVLLLAACITVPALIMVGLSH